MIHDIRVLYSDTTYDVIIGEVIQTNEVVAAVIDYDVYTSDTTISSNIIRVPDEYLIRFITEIKKEDYAHTIPIIKHAPHIFEIMTHPSEELIIVSPCYNVFNLIQRLVPNKTLTRKNEKPENSDIPIVDLTSISTSPPKVLQLARTLISDMSRQNRRYSSDIEFIKMRQPGFTNALCRSSPNFTRFFKVCVHT